MAHGRLQQQTVASACSTEQLCSGLLRQALSSAALHQLSDDVASQPLLQLVSERCCCITAGYAADGKQYSLLDYLLWETEQMHGRIRRYTSPDEHAFFARDLPPLVLPPIQYPEVLLLWLLTPEYSARVRQCSLIQL